MHKLSMLILLSAATVSLSACQNSRPKVKVVAMQQWTQGPDAPLTGQSSAISQAQTALCLNDTQNAYHTDPHILDSWPTKEYMAPCMKQAGLSYENKQNEKPTRHALLSSPNN